MNRAMNRRGLWLLLAFLSTWAGAENFYPQENGMRWRYDNGEVQVMSGPRSMAEITEALGVEMAPNLAEYPVMTVSKYLNDTLVTEDYLIYTEDAVYSLGSTITGSLVFWYDVPSLVYQGAQLRIGDNWASRSTVEKYNVEITTATEVLGMRGVETPAGRFNALVIRQDTVGDNGIQNYLDMYFVPTVGIVRFETVDGSAVNLVEKNF